MKVIVEKIPQGEETQVIFQVAHMTDKIRRAISILESPDKLVVYLGNERFQVAISDILYVETVDLKVFVYVDQAVYQSRLKLTEIEAGLDDSDFLRISKQMIVNIGKIQSVMPAGNGRFQASLFNGEKLIISRQYVPEMKRRFGV